MHKHLGVLPLLILFSCFLFKSAPAEETLSWQDCLREAAKNHPDLLAAQESVKESQAAKQITASTLYPQIDSNLNASTARTSSGTTSSISDSYAYGLSGTQLIFDGTKTINNVRAAAENITAARESFKFTSATVRFRLRSAFIDLLKSQESLRITQEIYEIRRDNLELITLRYYSGLEHKGALLTAEADLDEAQYEISKAEREVEVARRELVKEMGRRHLAPLEVKGDFTVKDAALKKPDFEIIAKNNPSLLQLVAQKNAAEFGVRSAYANFFPTLSGTAGANKNGSRWTPKGNQWNLGLSLSLPIFEGGLRFAQVSQARALLSQLQENERSTKDAVVLTLEQAWAALQDAIENARVQEAYLTATQERSRIAQAQYSTGFIAFDNWTIIEDNLVKAKRTLLDAQANALLTEASWIQAKGEVLEYAQ